eukprot:2704254-Pleurochrysis_carterae.AAC.1
MVTRAHACQPALRVRVCMHEWALTCGNIFVGQDLAEPEGGCEAPCLALDSAHVCLHADQRALREDEHAAHLRTNEAEGRGGDA